MMIDPPSLNSGNAFCTVKSVPRVFKPKIESKSFSVMLPSLRRLSAHSGAREQHVDAALFPLHRIIQAVQVVQIGRIALHAGHVPADQFDGLIQSFLPPARDEDIGAFFDKQLAPWRAPCRLIHLLSQQPCHRAFSSSFLSQYPVTCVITELVLRWLTLKQSMREFDNCKQQGWSGIFKKRNSRDRNAGAVCDRRGTFETGGGVTGETDRVGIDVVAAAFLSGLRVGSPNGRKPNTVCSSPRCSRRICSRLPCAAQCPGEIFNCAATSRSSDAGGASPACGTMPG